MINRPAMQKKDRHHVQIMAHHHSQEIPKNSYGDMGLDGQTDTHTIPRVTTGIGPVVNNYVIFMWSLPKIMVKSKSNVCYSYSSRRCAV